jgi:hypothetical protein
LYEEEKRRTNALLFRFFSKLLDGVARTTLAEARASGEVELVCDFLAPEQLKDPYIIKV